MCVSKRKTVETSGRISAFLPFLGDRHVLSTSLHANWTSSHTFLYENLEFPFDLSRAGISDTVTLESQKVIKARDSTLKAHLQIAGTFAFFVDCDKIRKTMSPCTLVDARCIYDCGSNTSDSFSCIANFEHQQRRLPRLPQDDTHTYTHTPG